MKVSKLPRPEPWNTDTAVSHLYRAWSNQGRVQLRQIVLLNPNMVAALKALWQLDHQRASDMQSDEDPGGVLTNIGSWRLLQEQGGSGMIVIKQREERHLSE